MCRGHSTLNRKMGIIVAILSKFIVFFIEMMILSRHYSRVLHQTATFIRQLQALDYLECCIEEVLDDIFGWQKRIHLGL